MVLKNRTCLGWVSITVLVGQFHRNIHMADMQEDLWRFIVYAENNEQIKNLLEDKFVPAASGGK